VPKTGLTKGLALPLEEYKENYSERRAISSAEGKLENACMAHYGFTWAPPSAGSPHLATMTRTWDAAMASRSRTWRRSTATRCRTTHRRQPAAEE
jgi:hypothetical protein